MNDENESQKLLSLVRDFFALRVEFKVVIVYGSLATGRFAAHSDIDVACYADHVLSFEERADLQFNLSQCVKREIDLLDLRCANGLILREVLTQGEYLKTDDYVLMWLRTEMFSWVEDYLPIIQRFNAAKIKEFIGEN